MMNDHRDLVRLYRGAQHAEKPHLLAIDGIAGPIRTCEECENHVATISVDLGECEEPFDLCGLCCMTLILDSEYAASASTVPTS